MLWTVALLLYFAVSAFLAWGGRRLERASVWLGASPFLIHLALIGVWAGSATPDQPVTVEVLEWVPSLGVAVGFRIGTLALIFSAIVAGIGLLIVLYSWRYFGSGPRLTKFLALLALFSGGMAGLVSSDELFGLFVFWEITTVASYLLIGFDDTLARARSAALQAVLVTTAGGLAMLGGFVVLALQAGTTSISGMVAAPPSGTAVTIALVLVFVGAFTKSAQVPFHFWLPGAMAAPTPASAYLHSATMVKGGVILLILLAPAFASSPVWAPVVTTVGLATMVWGALVASRQTDLKLLLAHGTVSQLGFMVALIGLDLIAAAVAVLVGHALFKAGLFLVVGAIDKGTGTRDIRELAGLGVVAPGLAVAGALLAASMAGIPPLLGFVTKEAALDSLIAAGQWPAVVVIAAASVVTVGYTIRFWWGGFMGDHESPTTVAKPAALRALTVVPVALAGLSLVVGVVPGGLDGLVETSTGQSVKLVLWPGFTTALWVSLTVIGAGAVLGWFDVRRPFEVAYWRRLSAAGVYQASLAGLNRLADRTTGLVQNGSLPTYLAIIVTTVVTVPLVVWLSQWDGAIELALTNGIAEVALGGAAVAGAVAAARAKRRLAAVLMLGLVGYSVSGIYVVFGAPDLALTQVLIETLTVALFALVLVRLPRRFGKGPQSLSERTRIAVAAIVGVFAATAAVVITSVDPDRSIANAYIANAEAAGGTNVVNIILTNFRALDTLGEITVLAAAAIGISALVAAGRRRPDDALAPDDEQPQELVGA